MPNPGEFTWDPRAAQYRDAAGRFVSRATVRAEIDRALEHAQREVDRLARRLQRRTISARAWELAMRREIKRIHSYSAAAAKGGWAQMSQADHGRVGQLVREQYKYLKNFSRQIVAGLPRDGRFLRRVELYAQATRMTYEQTHLAVMREAGFTEQRSVLQPAEHCQECLDEADKGWGPLGHVSQVGTRTCLSRCKCLIQYRRAA